MSALEGAIAESQRREAYRQGVTDGAAIALLGPAAVGRPHTIFGKRVEVALVWPDGPPPQRHLDGMLARAQARQVEHDGPVDFRVAAAADGYVAQPMDDSRRLVRLDPL